MTQVPSVCREIQDDLVGAAMREADPQAQTRVREHVGRCVACRKELERYRALDEAVKTLRTEPLSIADPTHSRAELEVRLADLRSRLVTYRVVPSPLGRILIGCTEQGVSRIQFVGDRTAVSARRGPWAGIEAVADGAELERLGRELLDYLEGRRVRLDWPIDWRLARSDFQRRVLHVTAQIPYGAVTSYANIAREMGRPAAVRAVAQALRWNPMPIAIPCHRVVGASGDLTGYAGKKITLKQRLLGVEGVRTIRAARDFRILREAMYATRPGENEYCLPTCGSLPSLTLARLTLFASRDRAEAAGLAPCRACRPDLHPISQ